MKIKIFIFLMLFTLILIAVQPAFAWLVYTKPEFRGKAIDAETRQAVEGAVVVVLYNKWEFGGPAGGNTLPMDAKEILTDKEGEFYFPSYITLIGPLSRASGVSFIIFKPGYMSVTRIDGIEIPEENYFTVEKEQVGKEGEIKYVDRWKRHLSYKGPLGIVELRKAKTWEERRRTRPGIGGTDEKKLPLFLKIVEDEYRNLYK